MHRVKAQNDSIPSIQLRLLHRLSDSLTRTTMKRTVKSLFLLSLLSALAAIPAAAQPMRLTARQHYEITVNGRAVGQMTELMYTRGDRQDGFVTLVSDNEGRRYI